MTSQIQDKLAKEIAEDHEELLEKDQQILSAEHSQQKEIQELNAKLDAILERLNKD